MQTKKIHYKVAKLNGDVLTPITIFLRLEGTKKFLLESSLKHSEQGRYSFIGVNPVMDMIGDENGATVISKGSEGTERKQGLPLDILQQLLPNIHVDLPFPFYGGAVGYVGYDAIRPYVHIGKMLDDEIGMPDIHFMVYENVIVFDHLAQSIYIVVVDLFDQHTEDDLQHRLDELKEQVLKKETDEVLVECEIEFKPKMEKPEFLQRIEKGIEYIEAGEVEQVVLSQRMVGEVKTDPFQFYRILRNSNPSPYMFYVDFSDYVILGASPESFVKTKQNKVFTNPIAGTRPRGKSAAEDQMLAQQLLADEKELSEHRMLVDLSKEDLKQICVTDSIATKKYMKLEYYRHVMHIVSELEGTLKTGKTGMDALISCLPAGTVSGAPKERAMQIINELEEYKRGVYAGAIGYVNANGDTDFALAIRSLVIKNHHAYLQAGAGIVRESIPEHEYEETINKAEALLKPRPL